MQDTSYSLIMGFLNTLAITIVCFVAVVGTAVVVFVIVPWIRKEWKSINRQIQREKEAQRRAQLEQEQKHLAKVIQLRNVEVYNRKSQLIKIGSQNGRALNNKA